MAAWLESEGVPYKYEGDYLKYTIPAKPRKYTPDFWLNAETFIEVKGKLDLDTRKKMEQVRIEYPMMRMIIVFGKPFNTLRKGSKTTYADWAEKNGFEYYGIDQLNALKGAV